MARLGLCRDQRAVRTCRVHEAGEQEPPVRGAEQRVDGMLRMGHETHDVARLVDDSGHVSERTVHVLRVPQHDLTAGGELHEGPPVRIPGAVAVLDGDYELLPRYAPPEEDARGVVDTHGRVTADELELPVRTEDAGEETGLAEDLEPVADAEHRPTSNGELADYRHEGREARDRAGAQVVAVREASRKHDGRGLGWQLGVRVPDELRLGANRTQRPRSVVVVVRAGKDDDGDDRLVGHSSSRISKLSIRGLARSSVHMRSICERASSAPSASTSRSTTRPTRALETSNPSFRNDCRTASPCGSRMPSFGRTRTDALTGRS